MLQWNSGIAVKLRNNGNETSEVKNVKFVIKDVKTVI